MAPYDSHNTLDQQLSSAANVQKRTATNIRYERLTYIGGKHGWSVVALEVLKKIKNLARRTSIVTSGSFLLFACGGSTFEITHDLVGYSWDKASLACMYVCTYACTYINM
jgi:hypothetical protein